MLSNIASHSSVPVNLTKKAMISQKSATHLSKTRASKWKSKSHPPISYQVCGSNSKRQETDGFACKKLPSTFQELEKKPGCRKSRKPCQMQQGEKTIGKQFMCRKFERTHHCFCWGEKEILGGLQSLVSIKRGGGTIRGNVSFVSFDTNTLWYK